MVLIPLALAQEFPDQLYNLQNIYEGTPDVSITSFEINQLPHTFTTTSGTKHFSPATPLQINFAITNEGSAPAIGNFRVTLTSDVIGRDAQRTIDILNIIERNNQLIPLTIHPASGAPYEDFPQALDIFTGKISTVDTSQKLQQEKTKGSIFFYQLEPKHTLRVAGTIYNDLQLTLPTLGEGTHSFTLSVSGTVTDSTQQNNAASTSLEYTPQYYITGPVSDISNVPTLTQNELFLLGTEGACRDAILQETFLTVCLEDASFFHANFNINDQPVSFGIFEKWFKLKETFTIDNLDFLATAYSNGIKITSLQSQRVYNS